MIRLKNRISPRALDSIILLFFTILGFVVMGYHPGFEDDGIYLAAVKSDLDPGLYPHDADFFRLQLQATVFDRWMAAFVRFTHIPLAWSELLWQCAALFATLWAAHRIARRLFSERRAQWAGVALLAAMFTLPVAGSAINIADQHLHPRNLATALILFAVDRTLARRTWSAVLLLITALLVHPIMAACGVSLCFFLALAFTKLGPRLLRWRALTEQAAAIAGVPFLPAWIFESPTPTWRRALNTRSYYFLYQWTWYEWLGAVAPLALFWLLASYAVRRGSTLLARFALGLCLYGIFQQAFAMVVLAPASLIRITPLQPMRYLHLVYVFLVLCAGCLLGKHLLARSPWRWILFLIVVNGSMFASQRMMLPGTEHLELPGRGSRNSWLQAFAWISRNTPRDAYFALDPDYLAVPGEDYHSFRALAERSQLADAVKDAAVVTQVPELGPRWAQQVDAQRGWTNFQFQDFERLQKQFGVDWVLLSNSPPARLTCIWHKDSLTVCRIPRLAPASNPLM